MAKWAMTACATVVVLLSATGAISGQQAERDPLIAKAVAYVRDYTKSMASVVCEEQQTQRVVRHDGKVEKTRTLTSDVAFVDTGGGHAFSLVVFRDVMAVDGKPVRNREERLRKLLMSDRKEQSHEQAVRITKEGARYNIGQFSDGRGGNVDPLIAAVWWFQHDLAAGKVTRTENGVSFSTGTRRPASNVSGSVAVRGHYVLDTQGRVTETLWTTDDPTLDSRVTVRYREHPKLPVLVPSEMVRREQMVDKPKTDISEAQVTYANCRQFQVTVEETIQLPKP